MYKSNNYLIKILPLIMILVGNCLAMDCLACIRTIPNGRYHTCLFGCTKVTSDLKFCGRGFLGRRFFVFLLSIQIHFINFICSCQCTQLLSIHNSFSDRGVLKIPFSNEVKRTKRQINNQSYIHRSQGFLIWSNDCETTFYLQ